MSEMEQQLEAMRCEAHKEHASSAHLRERCDANGKERKALTGRAHITKRLALPLPPSLLPFPSIAFSSPLSSNIN